MTGHSSLIYVWILTEASVLGSLVFGKASRELDGSSPNECLQQGGVAPLLAHTKVGDLAPAGSPGL